MRAWRNWQLRKRAHPVGDKASWRRRRNKKNCDKRSKATMFQAVPRGATAPNNFIFAGVAELADAPDLGSGGFHRGGSSPFARTNKRRSTSCSFFCFYLNFDLSVCLILHKHRRGAFHMLPNLTRADMESAPTGIHLTDKHQFISYSNPP